MDEGYIKDAKETAKAVAKHFLYRVKSDAEDLDIDYEWFLEEVLKNIHALKGRSANLWE